MASTLIVDQLQKTGGSTTALTLPTSNASANEFLKNDGAGALSWGSAAAGFSKYTVVTATDTTFDLQSGTTKLIIEVQASGGYAGNTDGSVYRGGSGGSGAYARKFLSAMVDTDKLNITIGSVAPIASSGTTTSVASAIGTSFATITCVGGAGGTSGSGAWGVGGAGGALPTTGDFNIAGGDGCNGVRNAGYETASAGAFYSVSNGLSPASASIGPLTLGYGGGGSASNTASGSGNPGGTAVVIVWEYK